jgi:hypothetical protein
VPGARSIARVNATSRSDEVERHAGGTTLAGTTKKPLLDRLVDADRDDPHDDRHRRQQE